jgi:uncharacterized protein YjiS (DUF1127 family)
MIQASSSLIQSRSAGYASESHGLLPSLAKAFAWVLEERRIKRTVGTLRGLNDRTLADIGIDRSQIAHVARYGRNYNKAA